MVKLRLKRCGRKQRV
ncbi:hypothetical protein H6P81_chloro000035, partial (chloroplast) [Aristolochia fimbriata]